MTAKNIVLEGPDGTGKTTMAKMLVSWLEEQGTKAIYTGHPGSTSFGKSIREITHNSKIDLNPLTEALVFVADHNAFIEQILKPKMKEDIWVISDRNNFISGLAYQIASGCSLDVLDKIQDTIPDPPKADLLFVLYADRDVVTQRTLERGADDRFENLMKNDEYYEKVNEAYIKMVESDHEIERRLLKFVKPTTTTPRPVPRCVGIDANRPQGRVFSDIISLVKPLLSIEIPAI